MRFTKMQGVGNDFVVVSEDRAARSNLPALAIAVCDRHTGAGADGLLTVGRDAGEFAFTFRMFNPDGTEDMCGNGLRCAVLWALREGWIGPGAGGPFTVWTKEDPRRCRIVAAGDDLLRGTVEVDMGRPKLAPAEIACLAS